MGNILVINCGSSSLKFVVVEPTSNKILLSGLAERLGTEDATISYKNLQNDVLLQKTFDHVEAIEHLLNKIKELDLFETICAVGHRVVHGGELFSQSTVIDQNVLDSIKDCIPLAPLHNPANLIGIEIAQKFFSHVSHVAVFDTAFHQTLPLKSYLYAIPMNYYRDYKIRRYGFHGTSHRYISIRTAEFLEKEIDQLNIISMHLGNGSSVCAIKNGKSVDTSMGFTPLEGLMMGTRSGDVDPSIVLYLSEKLGISVENVVNKILNKESGLMGISESSNDYRAISQNAEFNEQCRVATEIFTYRLAKYVAAYMVNFDSIDALIFTGGIGENSVEARKMTLDQLKIFGYEIDDDKNCQKFKGTEGSITRDETPKALVLCTNEERMIALDTLELVKSKC